MEFWKCLNEGKSLFLPEELELPVEVVVNTRNKVSGQDEETHYDTSNCPFASSLESNGGQELIQFGFPDTLGRIRQGNCSDPSRDVLRNQIGLDCYTEVASPTRGLSDVVSQEKQMGSRMPSLFVGSDCLELPTVDLKLGGLTHSVGARDGESSKSAASVHSSMPAVPTKRSRLASAYSQTPVCQVHGCNKDLSSYKDYYKRHKVCDAHTKTTKVIVKGIEQRFCQQCSRFHLLSEFDDGKRSCRKRLANHNERRRKSPGTRFLRSSSIKTSFLFQEMLPTTTSSSSKHEAAKWFSHMKYEDPTLDSNLLLNFRDNFSAGAVDKGVGIAVPNEQDFAHIPDSSRALSLLSAQSLNPSDQLLGTAMSNPSVSTISHQNYISAPGLTYSSTKNSENIGPSGFHSPAKAGPTTTVSSGGVQDDSILFGSNTSNNKYNLSSGQGTVVDLLQLSSHLQMVEHKRNLMH